MAKNLLSSTSYRNLDVDAYDPDKFVDGCDESVETPGIGPDEGYIKQLLQSNKTVDALKAALSSPPLKTKNQVSFLEYTIFFYTVYKYKIIWLIQV